MGCLPLTHLFCVADLDHLYSAAPMKVFLIITSLLKLFLMVTLHIVLLSVIQVTQSHSKTVMDAEAYILFYVRVKKGRQTNRDAPHTITRPGKFL